MQLQAVAPVADKNSVRRIVSAGLGLPREPCTELAAHTGAVQAQAQRRADPELDDTVLQRSERCRSGLELWRKLYREMRGANTQIAAAEAKLYQNPQRAPNLAALWGRLERWLTLGADCEAAGFEMPDHVKANALLELVPRELEQQLISRSDIQGYGPRLAWIKAQLAHQRGVAQAAALVDSKNDMQIGALQNDVHSLGTERRGRGADARAAAGPRGDGEGEGEEGRWWLCSLPASLRRQRRRQGWWWRSR